MTNQKLKNIVGDILGYGRCPVTKDTYWHGDIVSVPYSENSGVMISARALSEIPADKIAQVVFEKSKGMSTFLRRYSLEEITKQIPNGCIRLSRQ